MRKDKMRRIMMDKYHDRENKKGMRILYVLAIGATLLLLIGFYYINKAESDFNKSRQEYTGCHEKIVTEDNEVIIYDGSGTIVQTYKISDTSFFNTDTAEVPSFTKGIIEVAR